MMKAFLLSCGLILISFLSPESRADSPYDGALHRFKVGYSQIAKADVLAVIRVDSVSLAGRRDNAGALIHTNDLRSVVIDGSGAPAGERLTVIWPAGPGGYLPRINGRYLLVAQRPRDGFASDPFFFDETRPRVIAATASDITGYLLIPTLHSSLHRGSSGAETLCLSVADCMESGDPGATWRARALLELNGPWSEVSGADLFGRSADALSTYLLSKVERLSAAQRVVVLDLLARWHVRGVREAYIESLLTAGREPKTLAPYYALGLAPTWDLRYEDQGLIHAGKKPLTPLWNCRMWADKLAACRDAYAANMAVMSGQYPKGSPRELKPLLARLNDDDVPTGVLVFVANVLGRRDLAPVLQSETPDSLAKKRHELASALTVAMVAPDAKRLSR